MKTQTKLTKPQYETLSKYVTQLDQSTHNYVTGLKHNDIITLKPIYESFGYHLTSTSCSGCIIQMLKTLNKFYQEYAKKTERN
jgi:hypothetical protein